MTNISILKSNILLASFAFSQILLSSAAYSQSITDNDERTYFNRAIIFGDSLSDNGTFDDDVTALTRHVTTDGRFSNGRVWNEYLFRNQKRGTIFGFKWDPPFFGRRRTDDFGDNTPNRDINVNYAIGGTKYQSAGRAKSWIIPSIADEVNEFIHGKNAISPRSIVSLNASIGLGRGSFLCLTYLTFQKFHATQTHPASHRKQQQTISITPLPTVSPRSGESTRMPWSTLPR
ncbi:hypothetical protein WKW50_18110 [Ochrobactrum sp. GPK 3]